ncbi:MAG: response regulator transcription factor [Lachnospiraceae bacterium]|jgi:DNA-binding LytR/AlgR family response regulator|nr:response regulator transcription factor [Lachnospiraceae bacterium]
MNIVVCDDDAGARMQMKEYLCRFEKEHNTELTLRFYESGEAFLSDYPEKMDILFLDIRMYQVSGMDIARRIRDFDDELCIIFISNMTQYALEGYRVHAFDFLVKPFGYRTFEREMALAVRRAEGQKNDSITIKNDDGVFRLFLREILYVETGDHRLLVHGREKDLYCYVTMGQLEKKLGEKGFFRCHQSFLINLAYVEELGKDSVTMRDGACMPVSRHRRKELLQAMTRYAGEVL